MDLAAKSADVTFDGSLSPGLSEPLSERTGVKIRRFADLTVPLLASGRVRLSPGWKFSDVRARVDTGKFSAYGVHFDEARGVVSFDGTHFAAREAVAVSGDNLAEGSYEQDFSTLEFRYLLTGRLRPLDISPWFGGDWWQNIFRNFDFPARPPDASIDVRGQYLHGRRFSVFGYADSKAPVVKGVPFDTARVLLYVDQDACDGLEIALTRDTGTAEGSFKLSTEPTQGVWSSLDIEASSTIDPTPLGKILPPDARDAVAAFSFDQAPAVSIRGHFDAAPPPRPPPTKDFHSELRTSSGLHVHGVAFDRAASFKFDLWDRRQHHRESDVEAGFAGGVVSGTADVTGAGAARRLRFKTSLSGASLGSLAAAAAEGYVVSGPVYGTSTALDTFAKDKSGVRLDLNASAEGRPGELATFVGDGSRPDTGREARRTLAPRRTLQGPQVPRAALHAGQVLLQDRELRRQLHGPERDRRKFRHPSEGHLLDRPAGCSLDFSATHLPFHGEQVAPPGLQRHLGPPFGNAPGAADGEHRQAFVEAGLQPVEEPSPGRRTREAGGARENRRPPAPLANPPSLRGLRVGPRKELRAP